MKSVKSINRVNTTPVDPKEICRIDEFTIFRSTLLHPVKSGWIRIWNRIRLSWIKISQSVSLNQTLWSSKQPIRMLVTFQVVYFTALFPYVVLIIFFIRACLLPNFYDGVKFYLQPDLTRLFDAVVSAFSQRVLVSPLFPQFLVPLSPPIPLLNPPRACWQWANDASSSWIFRIVIFAVPIGDWTPLVLCHFAESLVTDGMTMRSRGKS